MIVFIIVLLVVVLIIAFAVKIKSSKTLNVKEVDILKLEDVISFFKTDANIKKLNENKDFMAVAIKKFDEKNGNLNITACIYDKNTLKIVASSKSQSWNAKSIDESLSEAFGDKSMIIFD